MSSVDGQEGDRHRIEGLIAALEELDDPRGRDHAKALLEAVLELHGAGLARMMEIVGGAGAAGVALIESLALDERCRAMLLLHDLHPHDLASRVQTGVDKLRASLGPQGIRIELVQVGEEGVRLKLSGNLRGKHARVDQTEIEQAIFLFAPDVAAIHIDGLPDPDLHEVRFVPASVLRGDVARAGA